MKTHETTLAIDATTFDLVDITPDLAEIWLSTANTANRALSRMRVEQMVHDMSNGEWRITPDLIAFNADGVLINGQHRLAAIAKSGVTIRMWVMKNLPLDAFQVTDDVKRRSFGDYLSIQGVPQHNNVASLVAKILTIEQHGKPKGGFTASTTSELVNYYRTLDLDELVYAVRAGNNIGQHTGATRTAAALAVYLTMRVDPEDGAAFIDEVLYGSGQGMVFREAMLRDRAQPHPSVSRNIETVAAYYIKAWNAWREGNDLRLLRYRRGGAKPEQFPTPN